MRALIFNTELSVHGTFALSQHLAHSNQVQDNYIWQIGFIASMHACSRPRFISFVGFILSVLFFFGFLNQRWFGCRFPKPWFRFGFRLTNPTQDRGRAKIRINSAPVTSPQASFAFKVF